MDSVGADGLLDPDFVVAIAIELDVNIGYETPAPVNPDVGLRADNELHVERARK